MKNLFKFVSVASLLYFIPLVTSAATTTCIGTGLTTSVCKLQQLLNSVIPLLVTLGVVYFVWGVVQYVIGGGDEAKKKGKDTIIYGIIGLFVIISVWGLVNVVAKTFGLEAQTAPDVTKLVSLPPTDSSCNSIESNSNFADVLNYFTCIIGTSVIPFIFAIAMVTFIWGVVKFFIINADEEKKRSEGKQFMIWGIIALAVMISIWGLVNILGVTFGIDNPVLPSVRP